MKLELLLVFSVIVGIFTAQDAAAQNRTVITGRVFSSEGQKPLAGVSIKVRGTSQGTTTNAEGDYSITVASPKAVLVVSSIGFEQQDVPVNSRSVINVTLTLSSNELQQVVVIGYGTVKKRDLTGSVSQVKAEDINAYPASSVLQALQGRASGVQVLQNSGGPGDAVSIRIRGTNSIKGDNEPLYVVDGFPLSGNPTVLNNADIESIEILKDASATAIYGSRGANGVVLITTKRGKAGKTKVNFESSYSVQTLRKKLDFMNAKEYAQFYNEQAKNDNLTPYFSQAQIDSFGTGFDWQDLVFQKAPMKTLALNVNGGNEKTQYSFTGSVLDQDGIIRGSNYKRYSLGVNLNNSISDKVRLNFSTLLSRNSNNRLNEGRGSNRGGSMISAALSAPPTLTPYNNDGSYRVLTTAYSFISNSIVNPLNYINEETDLNTANKVLANVAFMYNPIPELTIKLSGGIENTDAREDSYRTTKFVSSAGQASVSTSQFTSLLSENTVTYNRTFKKKHNLAVLGGFTYQNFISTSLTGGGVGFINDVGQTYDLNSASTPGIPGSGYSKSVIMSYLGRINYTYNDKYLATVSFRSDGSSKYSEGHKWGNFPSAALAWRVSKEDFLKNVALLSDLKLRLGWGFTGSQAIGPYTTLSQLVSGKTVFNGSLYTTFSPSTRLPGNLKWETTEQKDIGIDVGVLNNRILFTADYYVKNTHDLLNDVELPPSSGYANTIQNIGEVQNHGFEFGVDAKLLRGAFKWNVNANLSVNRNKVVRLADGEDILGGKLSQAIVVDNTNILREGQPIGMFWGYVEDGYDSKGHIVFKDLDKDGAITPNDRTYIGNPNPDFIYGFNSDLSYKNFDFSFFLQGVKGNDLFNVNAINNTIDYGYGLNMPREVYNNHWTPANTNAKYPVISRSVTANVSNRFVEDGSYLRLKNIQLAYNFPVNKLGGNWIRNLQVYVSGQNLLTFTKYSWFDPEVNASGGSASTTLGLDWYSYPTSKSVTFGIRAGF
ncbi:SusC/RagA family TonB-linked outer membrane protein [Flavisolibacter ginsenosidimutans]|uniref:TonB-dependent receptor n=1 Tax=Flavisolibacter ginsenosidimutans TaxID=661481 RepID=A0A5B8UI27_9BACT|nr:TonB-dependent receptor [Flavisolibacter ginsenosidimutans]QEC56317.1 TonB-dependent receptor [Flavisolibacter ginsenosidimutans]